VRTVAGHALWVGHAGDLWDFRRVLDAGVAAVVELAGTSHTRSGGNSAGSVTGMGVHFANRPAWSAQRKIWQNPPANK
jgi:hypothetical protein